MFSERCAWIKKREREREVCVNRVCGWVDPSLMKGVCDLEYENVHCCVQGQAEILWTTHWHDGHYVPSTLSDIPAFKLLTSDNWLWNWEAIQVV